MDTGFEKLMSVEALILEPGDEELKFKILLKNEKLSKRKQTILKYSQLIGTWHFQNRKFVFQIFIRT